MNSLKYISLFVVLFSLQSCFTAKTYVRPEQVVDEKYFRSDQISDDTSSIANLDWREIFKDEKLQDYIATALANNLDIRMALQQIEVAAAYVRQGKAGYFPTFNLGADYAMNSPSLNSLSGQNLNERSTLGQYELFGNLSWEADIWGKIRSNDRATRAEFMQTVAAHQAIKSRLVSAVASAYYQLVSLDAQRNITEETIETRKQSIETINALKSSGYVTEVAVKQTEAQLFNAQALLLDIDNNIKLMENTMCVLMGESPHGIDRNALESQTMDTLFSIGVPIQLLSNRPDVLAAENGLISAFELTNVARSNFYPSLRLTAGGGLQSLTFEKLFNVNSLFASIVGSLAQPIFNGRQVRTQYEVRRAQQEAAYLNYKQTILTASKEVSDALYTLQRDKEKIQLKQQEYQAYTQAIEYSEELLNYGLANYLEVLTARQNALNAQLAVTNTAFSRLNAMVQLYRAVGGGWK